MTGAGSSTLLFGLEESFKGPVIDDDSSGNPSYWHFGRNPSVTDLSLENQLQRMVQAGLIQSVESVAGNLEGAFNLTAVVNTATHDAVERVVFNDGGTGFTTGRAQSARVIAGSEYLDDAGGTGEKLRALKGLIPTDYELNYTQDGLVEYSLTCLYATEDDATLPTDITETAGGGDAAAHSFQLDVDGTTINDLQEATLSFSNLYSFRRGPPREAIAATLARPEASLDATAIWDGPDRHLDLAYGGQGATTPATRLSSVTATADVTVDGTTVSTYNLPAVKPDSYSWDQLINDGEQDTTEPVSFHVNNPTGSDVA